MSYFTYAHVFKMILKPLWLKVKNIFFYETKLWFQFSLVTMN